jgi:hypothetical protein
LTSFFAGGASKLVVMGSSVSTWGAVDKQLLWPNQLHKWLQSVADMCPRKNQAPLHFLATQEYSTSATLCNNATKVQLVDLSHAGVLLSYAERCLVQHVPEDAGLVIFEYCISDWWTDTNLNNPERRALETMIRYVLSRSSRPALVMLCAMPLMGKDWQRYFGNQGLPGGCQKHWQSTMICHCRS